MLFSSFFPVELIHMTVKRKKVSFENFSYKNMHFTALLVIIPKIVAYNILIKSKFLLHSF